MRHRGEFFKKCPGSDGQVCCNYFVINFASNCPMDCSYCYLQEYLQDNAALKVFSNVGDLIDEAERTLQKHRGVFFRIGTGEITDSLALEPYTGMARELIPYFAEQANVLLELKTKSDCVDSLLDLDPKGRVVVAWSMNPQPVIDLEEHDTASFSERLAAARRCQDAGYRLGFHFDPMIEYEGWQADYQAMLEAIFAVVDWRRLSWLSLGVLRETPGLKRTMRRRYPQSRLLTGEQVLCPDGKMRYFQPLRVEMYRKMVEWIRRQAPTVKIYLCMESREVWQQVFGFAPACEKELGNQMAPSLDVFMTNKDSPIGVFDSGIGGLTVLHQIIEALPKENTVYLGDTARAPYGTKSVETVLRYSYENSEFLVEKGVKVVVVACNTSTAIALSQLKERLAMPVIGVIEPGVRRAIQRTKNKKVGVIGTEATIQSGAYTRALKAADSAIEVYSRACPLFVPLVEEGWTDNEVVEMTAKAYLQGFKQSGIDTLILGCTHYPLLKKAIRKFMGPGVRLVDSAEETAKVVESVLKKTSIVRKDRQRGAQLFCHRRAGPFH